MPKLKFSDLLISTFLHSEKAMTSLREQEGRGVKNLGKSLSKSVVLENKVLLNFDFRHGAKKSSQSGHPFQSYGYL